MSEVAEAPLAPWLLFWLYMEGGLRRDVGSRYVCARLAKPGKGRLEYAGCTNSKFTHTHQQLAVGECAHITLIDDAGAYKFKVAVTQR